MWVVSGAHSYLVTDPAGDEAEVNIRMRSYISSVKTQ